MLIKNKLLLLTILFGLLNINKIVGMDLNDQFKALQDFNPPILDSKGHDLLIDGIKKLKIMESDLSFVEQIPQSIELKKFIYKSTIPVSIILQYPLLYYAYKKLLKPIINKLGNANKFSKESKINIEKESEFFQDEFLMAVLSSAVGMSLLYYNKILYNQSRIDHKGSIAELGKIVNSFKCIINKIFKMYHEKSESIIKKNILLAGHRDVLAPQNLTDDTALFRGEYDKILNIFLDFKNKMSKEN